MRSFHAGRATLTIIGTALLCIGAACLLPTNAYQRHTQLDGTIYDSLGWIYERTHFDPAPIDVAFIGASRTMLAISASRLEHDLAARGLNARVANLAVLAAGRNIHWIVTEELLATKKPRLIVIEINETPARNGHQAFQYVARNDEILTPPALGMHDSFFQLGYLPYRNLHLFLAAYFPRIVGIRDTFNPETYRGSTPVTSTIVRLPTGMVIDTSRIVSKAKLTAEARDYEQQHPPTKLPSWLASRLFADDRVYTELIADAARARGIPLVFLYIPYFSGSKAIESRSFYAKFGTVLDGGFLSDKDRMFLDWSHLNKWGARTMTDWVADSIAPMLCRSEAQCPAGCSSPGISSDPSRPDTTLHGSSTSCRPQSGAVPER